MQPRPCKSISFLLSLILFLGLIALPSTTYAYFSCAAQNFDTHHFMTTIDNHMLSLRGKNISKAYYDYTSSDFKKNTSLEEFRNLIRQYPALHNNCALTLNAIYFQENFGFYQGIATSREGEQLLVKFLLTEEKGSWKISSLQLYQFLCKKDKITKNQSSNTQFTTISSG